MGPRELRHQQAKTYVSSLRVVNETKAYGLIAIAQQLREAILELRGEDIKRVLFERLDLGKSGRKRLRAELGIGQHAAPVVASRKSHDTPAFRC